MVAGSGVGALRLLVLAISLAVAPALSGDVPWMLRASGLSAALREGEVFHEYIRGGRRLDVVGCSTRCLWIWAPL
jgi:hypothetical protein